MRSKMKRKKIKAVSFKSKGKAIKGRKVLRKRGTKGLKKTSLKRGGKRTRIGIRRTIPVQQQIDSYNKDYNAGFDSSYNEGYNVGYAEGLRDGQEDVYKGA